jgi:hypothetical protein
LPNQFEPGRFVAHEKHESHQESSPDVVGDNKWGQTPGQTPFIYAVISNEWKSKGPGSN